jgi:hypothetical protein
VFLVFEPVLQHSESTHISLLKLNLIPTCHVCLQLGLVITPELQVCCAAFNPWDDSLLAVAGPYSVRSYRLDLVMANARPNNLLMLVRRHQAAVLLFLV